MDTDRIPHRSTSSNSSTSTSELFICFTSRLSSSSSMKITSKSILSPGRARDSSQISLSTSLSRRLRSSGSIKGGQASPMFPATNGKKRGCSFENPEPSSPKVTCIGQVRVKTKKQGKKIRARSKSRREVSFRKTEQATASSGANSHNLDNHFQDYGHMGHQFQQQECLPHRNQRWVHLPITICEALRAFGAEFNCFLPCRSSCMASNQREKEEKAATGSNGGSTSSCGAVFARWLVAEKIELVVGEEEREEDDMPRRSQRRHVFEDIVIDGDKFEEKNEILEEEEARVSICIPPKNALLLMRCRSDPVKMAALANKFWECPPQDEVDEENEENEKKHEGEEEKNHREDEQIKVEQETEKTEEVCFENLVSVQIVEEHQRQVQEAEAETEAELDREEEQESQEIREVQKEGDSQNEQQEEQVQNPPLLEEETFTCDSSPEIFADPGNEENAAKLVTENENVLGHEPEPAQNEVIEERSSSVVSVEQEQEPLEDKQEQEAIVVSDDSTEEKETQATKKILQEGEEDEEETMTTTGERSEPDDPEIPKEPETGQESKEREGQKQQNLLPDCLLLMMCEPKSSMEVSKETWVCSTDFIRWPQAERKPPPQIVNKTDGSDEPKRRLSIDSNPAPQQQKQRQQLLMQPPRSSCSFPAAPPLPPGYGAASMNTMVEQKLVGTKPSYEPFVLKRCKSEPMRSSAKLAPEACFWKNRKLEPHPPATLGVGAAGVGF